MFASRPIVCSSVCVLLSLSSLLGFSPDSYQQRFYCRMIPTSKASAVAWFLPAKLLLSYDFYQQKFLLYDLYQ